MTESVDSFRMSSHSKEIDRLREENTALKAKVDELDEKLKSITPMDEIKEDLLVMISSVHGEYASEVIEDYFGDGC